MTERTAIVIPAERLEALRKERERRQSNAFVGSILESLANEEEQVRQRLRRQRRRRRDDRSDYYRAKHGAQRPGSPQP